MFLIVYYLIVSALAAACTAETSSADHCQACDVTINGKTYCSQCEANYVPIDGTCTQVGDNKVTTTAGCKKSDDKSVDAKSTTCGKCTGTNYFLHKGGCYDSTATPGQTICQTAGKTAGVCETCNAATGYFKNPEAAPTVDSCISCGDTTGVTIGADNTAKTYKGVSGCAKCDAPKTISGNTGTAVATCTKCTDKYLKTVDGTTTCVGANACKDDFFPVDDSTNGHKCVSCGDTTGVTVGESNTKTYKGVDGCKTCDAPGTISEATGTKAATCTECNANLYLKTVSSPTSATSCVTAATCNTGYFPNDNAGGKKKCLPCSDNNNGGIQYCSACTPIESPTTTVLVMCSACESNKKVSPGGSSCVAICPENSTEKENACICNSGFAPSGDKCTSSSANRSGLSTGAIAGISVAAVVVVGGLVGFLCWWFICRGKA